MPVVWSGLAPHPPIIVPAVGGHRCRDVAVTIQSMTALARDLMDARPDRLLIISPHTPRPRRGVASWYQKRLRGSFAAFGAVDSKIDLPNDDQFVSALDAEFEDLADLAEEPLDHGASVPLHFLVEAGWSGPTSVVGLPWSSDSTLDRLGKALSRSMAHHARWAILASGDMSHCLQQGAPCGYHPKGAEFDRQFVDRLQNADFHGALTLDPKLAAAARQDVVESCRVTWQATEFAKNNPLFLSYEGPFGVGYCVMRFDRHD